MATGAANWWDNPNGANQQQQQKEEPQQPKALTEADFDQRFSQRLNERSSQAQQRMSEYQAVSAKFQENKELSPYFSAAYQFFQELDSETGGSRPVGELYDKTVRHVEGLRRGGYVPQAKPKPRGGFPGTGQAYNGEDMPSNAINIAGEGRVGREDPAKAQQMRDDYMFARKLSLDASKGRMTEDQVAELVKDRSRHKEDSRVEMG